MDIETKERMRGWLVGVRCTAVDYYGGLPSIHFGQYLLSIGSAWRVTQGAEIVAASDSTDNVKDHLPAKIVGRVVTDLRIEDPCHDLLIDFAGECFIQTFADAETYESWNVTGGPDAMIVAGPGSAWSSF